MCAQCKFLAARCRSRRRHRSSTTIALRPRVHPPLGGYARGVAVRQESKLAVEDPRLLRIAAPPLSLAVRNTSPAESPSKPRTQGDGTRDLPEDSMKVSLPACPCSHLGRAPQSWRAVITVAHTHAQHTSNANAPKPCLHKAGGLAFAFLLIHTLRTHAPPPCILFNTALRLRLRRHNP